MRILRQAEAFGWRVAGLNVTDTAAGADKPVMLVYGGAFNPPHEGHVGALRDAHRLLSDAGYHVSGSIVAPTADKLLAKKQMDPQFRLNLQARANVAKAAFPTDIDGAPVQVHTGPSEDVERAQGKPRRTDLANWVQQRYPDHTVINVTGEDAVVPGAPPQHPSLYSGAVGSNHEGYGYLTLPRDEITGMSSSKIRAALAAGQPVPGMSPESQRAYHDELAKHRASLADPIMAARRVIRAAEGISSDDMDGLTWDWDKGKWVRRVDPESPLIPSREDKPFNYDRDWPGWRGALKQIQPNHSGYGDPWFAHEPGESFENLPEAFIPNPRFVTPEGAAAGWAEGDPAEVGPEDEREWREIKFRPGRGFYHPDTDEDAGEYEWAHARPDRKMLVSRERR